MNFLNQVKSSIYGPDFYSSLSTKPLGKSFRYYFELAAIIALLTTISFSLFILPKVQAFLNDFGESIVSGFPTELEIKLRDGKVAINTDEPYIVPIPESFEVKEPKLPQENMIVINTKENFDLEKFKSYKTFVLITESLIVFEDGGGKVSIESLSSVPNMTINRTSVSDWVEKTQPFVRAIPFLLPVLAFLAVLLAYAFNLIYIAIVSLIVMFILRLKKVETTYKHAYKVALHAYTLPMLLSFVFMLFGGTSLPLIPTVVLIVIVLINFKKTTPQAVSI